MFVLLRDPSIIAFDESLVGFILNVKSKMEVAFFTLPIDCNHWIAVTRVNGLFYNLDSKLKHPEAIGSDDDVRTFFREKLSAGGSELFVIKSVTKHSTSSAAASPVSDLD